jgi:hypothetical protein
MDKFSEIAILGFDQATLRVIIYSVEILILCYRVNYCFFVYVASFSQLDWLHDTELRHYTTSRKVAGSSPDEVDFFHPSSCIMVPWSTQPLTEMSTSNLPGG